MEYKKINDKFYSSSYWGLERSKNKWFSKYVKAKVLKNFMKPIQRKEALYDAGGGVGNWAAYFKEDFKKTIVSDISSIALNKIPEKDIVKVCCIVFKNKLENDSVDCIILMDVFEHIQEKDLAIMLEDLRRILRPGGRIIIVSGLYGWGFGIIKQRIFNPKKRLLGEEHNEGHVNRLTFEEYKTLFKKTGLIIDNYYFYSIFFQQITDWIKDNFAKRISRIIGHKQKDLKMGREGQSVKEGLRSKEDKIFLRIPFLFLSWLSYLDILIFGKSIRGNAIFFSLKKD
jgi:SAM-dependent methyltransferase